MNDWGALAGNIALSHEDLRTGLTSNAFPYVFWRKPMRFGATRTVNGKHGKLLFGCSGLLAKVIEIVADGTAFKK